MTDPAARRRQSAGTPVDGQFATETRAEPQVTLAAGRWATAAPMEIDKALDAELTALERARSTLEARTHEVHQQAGDRRERAWGQGAGSWGMSDGEARDRLAERREVPYAARALDDYQRAAGELAAVELRLAEIDAEFAARGGWTRAFLVTGNDGHVHSSMSCSTCNRQGTLTRFALMHEWSGADEGRIVADAGWRACTVCYPSAPTGAPPRACRRRCSPPRSARLRPHAVPGRSRRPSAPPARQGCHRRREPPGGGCTESESFTAETAASSWYVEQRQWRGTLAGRVP